VPLAGLEDGLVRSDILLIEIVKQLGILREHSYRQRLEFRQRRRVRRGFMRRLLQKVV
jgi:hypothetical protein